MSILGNTVDLTRIVERKSFTLGMVTAFCECVGGECKKIAFSPPMYPEDYPYYQHDVEKIVKAHSLSSYFEENKEMEESKRLCWWVIYKFEDALEEYMALRERGCNAMNDFDKFKSVLSYGTAYAEGADQLKPKLREKRPQTGVSDEVLLGTGRTE